MAKANVAIFIDPSLKATAIDVKQLPLCPTELPNDAVSKLRVKATIWKQQTLIVAMPPGA